MTDIKPAHDVANDTVAIRDRSEKPVDIAERIVRTVEGAPDHIDGLAVELKLRDAIATLGPIRDRNRHHEAGRHLSLAITHLEDAIARLEWALETV